LGKKLKKVKTWQKGTHIAGKALKTGGNVTMAIGVATGNPSVIAAGEGMKIGGNMANKTSKILKKV
jgi:hypothetical protein